MSKTSGKQNQSQLLYVGVLYTKCGCCIQRVAFIFIIISVAGEFHIWWSLLWK